MDDQLQELARDLRERALTYSFLARVLSDDEMGTDFLAALAAEVPATGTELDAFAGGLAGLDGAGLEDVRRDLAADHAATLLAMAAKPVSPYESVYTSEDRLMMQESRNQVVRAYAAAGFGKAQEYRVPEDHVSLELDFMAALGARAADAVESVLAGTPGEGALEAAEKDLNAQLAFLEEHLLAWTPQFTDELEKRAKTPFYRGAAQMLRAFMEQERSYLAELNAAQDAAGE